MSDIDVTALHRAREEAVFNDGSVAPITHWFDDAGDECGPFEGAVTAVAGPDINGNWHSLVLSEFDPVEVH